LEAMETIDSDDAMDVHMAGRFLLIDRYKDRAYGGNYRWEKLLRENLCKIY